jgi:dTDP-4-amino-4,6-dideoxygalactose transaminase
MASTSMTQEIPLVDLTAQYAPLREEILQAIARILDGMHLFLGPELLQFEHEFASYCGCSQAIGVSNGTDAIELTLRALGIGNGDEVITQPNSFIATAEAISAVGAIPVFVDVDPETATLDPNLLEAAITPQTRAIIPVHLYGRPAAMDAILGIARLRGIRVVEDASQAHGARLGLRRAGSMGDAACFSFYYSKNLGAYGEAGAVTTNDAMLGERVRLFRDHGSRVRYHHEVIGRNARMDEIQAAILRIKLRHLDEWNARRRACATRMSAALTGTSLALPNVDQPDIYHVFHLYVVRHPRRDQLKAFLAERGIHTAIHYPIPIHLQEAYGHLGHKEGDFPSTEQRAADSLSLPMYAELTERQIEYIADAVRSFELTTT